jgi:hypothetical protein
MRVKIQLWAWPLTLLGTCREMKKQQLRLVVIFVAALQNRSTVRSVVTLNWLNRTRFGRASRPYRYAPKPAESSDHSQCHNALVTRGRASKPTSMIKIKMNQRRNAPTLPRCHRPRLCARVFVHDPGQLFGGGP